jgi:enoyl-[acyl-carrier-protein] reductase (NADH)
MNLYHVMIDLKDDAKALSFAHALERWLSYLQQAGKIGPWRLMRRKLNLAADSSRDFLLEIEVDRLSQLDEAFQHVSQHSDEVEQLYYPVHQMIQNADYALFRPFPDENRAERVAIL